MKAKLIAAIVLLALVASGFLLARNLKQTKAAAEQAPQEQPVLPVQTEPAQLGEIRRSFVATGTVEATVDVGVVTKIPGKVARVYVEEGASVKSGQLLAVLEHGDLLAQLQQAFLPENLP